MPRGVPLDGEILAILAAHPAGLSVQACYDRSTTYYRSSVEECLKRLQRQGRVRRDPVTKRFTLATQHQPVMAADK